MSEERWRCFVAIAIGEELRRQLADAIAAWSDDPRTSGLRWVGPEALHLTLAFLGGVERARIESIRRVIGSVAAGHRPMMRQTGRLGAFARPGSARALWYGVDDQDGALAALAGDLASALRLEPDEPFRPHVTIGRARRGWLDLRGWIEVASEAAPTAVLEVDAIHLMRSHLGSGPARYETLASIPLGVHARV
jgi:RNA 2',3'-cyclic 3'-phosphodiesterase